MRRLAASQGRLLADLAVKDIHVAACANYSIAIVDAQAMLALDLYSIAI